MTATVSGAVRKATAALVKFASSSIFEICDASSVMNLAPSMEFATKAPIPGGVDRSCRPAMTRTLFPMASYGFALIHVAPRRASCQIAV